MWFEPKRHWGFKHGPKPRKPKLHALPLPRRLRAVPNATSEAAPPTDQNPVKRPEHLRTPPTCRANEQRPTAMIGKFAQRDSDHLLDISEAHKERRRLSGDDARRSQARGGSGRQVVDEAATTPFLKAAGVTHKWLGSSKTASLATRRAHPRHLARRQNRQNPWFAWRPDAPIRGPSHRGGPAAKTDETCRAEFLPFSKPTHPRRGLRLSTGQISSAYRPRLCPQDRPQRLYH
jgi:hypothetical protein